MEHQAFRGWLKVKEAAKYCGLSERKIRDLLKEGLRHSRLRSGTILIKVEWIDEYFGGFEAQENEVDGIVEEVVRGPGDNSKWRITRKRIFTSRFVIAYLS